MIKTLGKVALLLAVVGLLLVGGVLLLGSRNLSRTYAVAPHAIDHSRADLAEGQRLATAYVCTTCHGGNLAGTDFLQGMPMADLPAPNLTGGRYSSEELERAIRHGVGSDGRPLMIMPSVAYAQMSDQDLSSILAYIASIPPVPSTLIERKVGPIGRVAALMDEPELVTASVIDHDRSHPAVTPEADGEYLTATCRFCHAEDLGGAVFVAEGPMWAPNLTSHESGTGNWTMVEFRRAVQHGEGRDGRSLDPAHMPWRAFGALTDAELDAIWAHLHSIPGVNRPPPEE